MGLDIRLPLGLMFAITGALMTLYGLFTHSSEIYEKSLGVNLNLDWGVVMLVFGLVMYFLGRAPKIPKPPPEHMEGFPPRRSGPFKEH